MTDFSNLSNEELLKEYKNELFLLDIGVVKNERKLDKMFAEVERRGLSIEEAVSLSIKQSIEFEEKLESNARLVNFGVSVEPRFVYKPKKIDNGVPMFDFNPAHSKIKKFLEDVENFSYATVQGDSMVNAGIYDGNVLIVNKRKKPKNYDLVAATIDNRMYVKRFYKENGKVILISENDDYENIEITEFMDFQINGVIDANIVLDLK